MFLPLFPGFSLLFTLHPLFNGCLCVQVWYWLSWHNCAAIFKFFFPYINKQFEATGAKKVVHKSLIFRLRTVWFHIIFSMAGVGVVAWQLATMDYTQCGKVSEDD